MTVWAGVWCGLLVGVSVVLDYITGGVVAGPATGIDAVATFVTIVHAGVDTLAIVFSIDVTEIVVVVVLVTEVMAA